jgi:hypothetical protein
MCVLTRDFFLFSCTIGQLENENMDLKSQLGQRNGKQRNVAAVTNAEEENVEDNNICEMEVENYFDFNGHAVQL